MSQLEDGYTSTKLHGVSIPEDHKHVKVINYSLCSFLYPFVASSSDGPKIYLITFFSNTLNSFLILGWHVKFQVQAKQRVTQNHSFACFYLYLLRSLEEKSFWIQRWRSIPWILSVVCYFLNVMLFHCHIFEGLISCICIVIQSCPKVRSIVTKMCTKLRLTD